MYLGFKALAFPIAVMIGAVVSSAMAQAACAKTDPLFQISYNECNHYGPTSDNDTTFTYTDKLAALRACMREKIKASAPALKSGYAHGNAALPTSAAARGRNVADKPSFTLKRTYNVQPPKFAMIKHPT